MSRSAVSGNKPGRANRCWTLALAAALVAPLAWSAELTVTVMGDQGPLADAVVSVRGAATANPSGRTAIMDQRRSQFVPGVLPVQVGTSVSFPNSDQVRHQVYSFSRAKAFELPLYSGTPAAPVRFDTAGVVVVGCNIHDWMIGYIVVLDTPHFAKTGADGVARLSAPAGKYQLDVWHTRMAGQGASEPVTLVEGKPLAIALKPVLEPPPPQRASVRQRALLEKLRAEQRSR